MDREGSGPLILQIEFSAIAGPRARPVINFTECQSKKRPFESQPFLLQRRMLSLRETV